MKQIMLDYDSIPMPINIWDEEVGMVNCNAASLEFLGFSSKEEAVARFSERLPERQPCGTPTTAKAAAHIKRALADGYSVVENWANIINGEIVYSRVTVSRTEIDGRFYAVACQQDLRPLREASVKIKEAEERVKHMLDAGPFAVCLIDTDLQAVEWNASYSKLFGCNTVENALVSEYMPDLDDGKDYLAEFRGKHAEALREGYAHMVTMSRKMNGEIFPIEATYVRIEYNGGYAVAEYVRDLTEEHAAAERERKITERLRDSDERTQRMLDACPIAICMLDENMLGIHCNEKYTQMYGVTNLSDFIGNTEQFMPPAETDGKDYLDEYKEIHQKALHEGYARMVTMSQKIDGTLFPVESTYVRIEHGGGYAVVEYVRDLTEEFAVAERERKIMEQLRLSEERAKLLLDSSPMAVCIYDADMNEIDCNEVALQLYGTDREHINQHGLYIDELQPNGKNSFAMFNEIIETVMREGYCQSEYFCRKKDGTPLFLECTNVRLRQQDGSYIIAEYSRDLTEEKAMVERLRLSEERMQLILDASPLAISVFDADMNEIDSNAAAMKVYGTGEEKLLNQEHLFMAEKQADGRDSLQVFKELFGQALNEGFTQGEFMCRKLDGTPLPLECTYVRLRQNDGSYNVVEYARDLTEQKAAMQKELEWTKRLQLINDSMPIGVNFVDENFVVTDCNENSYSKIFGFANKQEYIDNMHTTIPTNGMMEKVTESFRLLKETGFHRDEWVVLNAFGEQVPLDVTAIRLNDGNGFTAAVYMQDLRPLREANKRLLEKEREVNEFTQSLLNAAPMFIEFMDENAQHIDCNEQTAEMFGLTRKEDFTERWADFSPEYQPDGASSAEKVRQLVQKTLQEGAVRFEWLHTRADGTPLPVESTFVRLVRDGKAIIVGYNTDLRIIKAATEELREADERAALMLNSTPVSCFLLKENPGKSGMARFTAIDCNQAALKLFGFDNKDEAIKNYWNLFPKYNIKGATNLKDVVKYMNIAVETGFFYLEEFLHKDVHGEFIPVEVSVFRLNYKGETVIACYQNDLRQIKAMVEEMKRIEIAEEESRSKTRFLARMSHEIRTPMNAVLGIATIELQKDTHPAETEEAFLRIYNSSTLLLTIINDILDLSKIEVGKMEILTHPYETESLIIDTVQLNLMHLGSKTIEFKLIVDENMPFYLKGDEMRIKQVLNNLLSNSFKYTDTGIITLEFSVGRGLASAVPPAVGDTVDLIVRVTDTGQGMTAEQIEKLFDMEFIRFNIQSNRAIEGSGLGMSIAHQLTTMMNGQITVESEPGVGSSFTVRIPQKLDDDMVLGKEAAEMLQNLEHTQSALKLMSKRSCEPMPYGRVLVVDDVESNLYVAKGMLFPYKINVEVAGGAREAIALIKNGEEFDIIFMDHMMPEIDGIEATKIIREMGCKAPIVALTANTVKGQEELFMSNGFSGFVAKPIDPDRLEKYLLLFIRDKKNNN